METPLHQRVFETDLPCLGFPGVSDGKESACNAGGQNLILGKEDPLENRTATHSSILVWRIPRTEEPGQLYSMGLQRVGHNSAANTHTHIMLIGARWCITYRRYLLLTLHGPQM